MLEARDRVAGRTRGGFLSNGTPVELGGQWVGPTQNAVLGLIDELGLETFRTHDDGDAVTVIDDRIVSYDDESSGLPATAMMEVGRLWQQLETMAARIDTSTPWQTPGCDELDRQTLDQWLLAQTPDALLPRPEIHGKSGWRAIHDSHTKFLDKILECRTQQECAVS